MFAKVFSAFLLVTAVGACAQATTEDKIAGDQWEDACRKIAEEGYNCADGEGKCYANPDKVRGRC
ncbi:hypothetical protein LB505_010142 [Fusarium chuoi]|nr:hypothetical protein LB505_010142 [Fusarium chuoi]